MKLRFQAVAQLLQPFWGKRRGWPTHLEFLWFDLGWLPDLSRGWVSSIRRRFINRGNSLVP